MKLNHRKVAFVLSGGGPRGALQVGALRALFEHSIQPQILVGVSIGAVNAAYLATDPCLNGVERLAGIWRELEGEVVFPGGYWRLARRVLRGEDSFFPHEPLREFFLRYLPAGIRQFGDLSTVELYVTAANLRTGRLKVFGEDPDDDLVDALVASTALPPYIAPQENDGQQYVDGGVLSNLPLQVAVDHGADEIYALYLGVQPETYTPAHGLLRILDRTLWSIAQQQLAYELRVAKLSGVSVHLIRLDVNHSVALWDFSHTETWLQQGYEIAQAYLKAPQPQRQRWRQWRRLGIHRIRSLLAHFYKEKV
ncbi:MAG TPA: patatin-like phospholipase family protein [Anaerolineae bacterium]|nr:patatin-like phospholipase family protein [Anaerolineae bacterium]HIQ04092.1 patatin-like phospholipase family protein [Anaerolineae bacterium]